ncbi:MAG: hypothetical protein ACPGVB_09570 [Chitinophagales bacterium]
MNKSLLALLISAIAFMASLHYYANWDDNILGGGDSGGYYLYLPALFIHQDLDSLDRSVEARRQYYRHYNFVADNPIGIGEAHHIGEGKQVNKYTIGVAMLITPFFLTAHFLAQFTSYPTDGYSFIYMYFAHLSCVFYVLMGLFILRRLLLNYFEDKVVALTLLIVALATNLYYFTVYNMPMSHSYLFFLYAVLIYATKQWYDTKFWKYAIAVGISAGWITMARPTEIICILIPIFYGITSFKDIKERFAFIVEHKFAYLAAILAYMAIGLPQLIYWKWLTGGFLYYSYTGEGFDWLHSRIYSGLFRYKNGWLAYTPVMYLAIIGIGLTFFNKGKVKSFLLPILLFLPLHIYIIYSWWCWNYINGFGSRPMVETYALLSIPLAVTLQFAWKKFYLLVPAMSFVLFCTWLNLFNTYQFSEGMMWSEDANKAFFWRVLGKTEMTYLDLVTYDSGEDQPNSSNLEFVKQLYFHDFNDSTSANHVLIDTDKRDFAFIMNKDVEFSQTYAQTIKESGVQRDNWLRVSVRAMRLYDDGIDLYRQSLLVTAFADSQNKYKKMRQIRVDNKPGNKVNDLWNGQPKVWGEAYYWVQVPRDITAEDVIKCYVWHINSRDIFIDDLKVELWREKI